MRFNFFSRNSAPTVNHEGAPAYILTPQVELYAAVATAALSDQFYETADTRLQRLRELVAKNDPVFRGAISGVCP
jgi:60 kDa SS-A/Ro ribonucleoprotein